MEKTNEELQVFGLKITTENVLFFDMDGTLIDSNFANYLSYKKAIQTVSKSDIDISYNPNKRFNRDLMKGIVPNLTDSEYEEIIKQKEDYYKENLSHTILNKLVVDILLRYSKINKTVMVTNCREDRALITLNYHNLTDKFSNIFFRQNSNNGKRINKFKHAISILGIAPNLVVAFENEEIEITNAKKAGIEFINPNVA